MNFIWHWRKRHRDATPTHTYTYKGSAPPPPLFSEGGRELRRQSVSNSKLQLENANFLCDSCNIPLRDEYYHQDLHQDIKSPPLSVEEVKD